MKPWIFSLRIRAFRALAILLLAGLSLASPSARAQFGEGTGAGTALLFDGVNDYVSVSNSPALNVFPLTVMGWFRSFDQGLDRALVNKYVGNSFNGYLVYLHQGHLRAWYFRDGSNFIWDGGRGLDGGFVVGIWQHFAFTVDATGGKLYVNGQLRATQPWTGIPGATTTAQEMRFGRYDNTYYPGELDEVSVWNVALSASAIANTMNRRILNNETGLVGYWRFSEGSGIFTADAAPAAAAAGNNAGTLFGGVTWVPSGGGVGPFVNTKGISAQTVAGGVNLSGEVNPLGRPTTAWFEWGTNTSYGTLTTPANAGSGSNFVTAGALLSGLQQGQTYHYRYVATNLNGRANGADQSFTQPVYPLPGGGPPLRSSAYDGGFASFAAFDPRPEWDTSVAMTIEAWVYRQDANRFETIVSHDAPGSYWLGFSPRLRFYRGTNFAEIATPVLAYKWTHVAVSYDGALARFYINGELAGIRALNNNGAGKVRELLLGHDDSHNTDIGPRNRFMGNLDEVRVWSVARDEAEIQDGLYREVRGEPGQVAVFPRGGRIEEISGLVGNIGSGVAEQVFGMVPRDLVVPRAAFPPSADGNINFATEYLGAEQLVIRYPDQPDLIDQRAYFVHTSNDLFVAAVVSSILPDSWNVTNSTLSLYIDTTNAKPALAEYPQAELRTPLDGSSRSAWLNGDGVGGYYFCQTPPGIGLPQPCTPRSLYQVGQQFCGGEISTLVCTEFRVSRTLLGTFNEFDGVAMGQVNFTSFGDQTFVPEGGFSASPATWLTMSYGEASASLPRVRWSGRVFSGLNTNNATILPGYRVSLIGNSAGYSQFTDIFGRFNFDVPMPTNESMFAQAELEAFGRYTLPRVFPGNVQPIFIGTNRVQFPGLPANVGTNIQLANVDFFVQRPLGAAAIVSATPTNPAVGMAVRQGGIGGTGEVVMIFGTNLHAEMEFYLAPVSATFPVTPEFWTLLPATVLSRDPGGNWVKVHAPFVPEFVREFTPSGVFIPSFSSRWRWVAHDSWLRPGRIEYSYTGTFNLHRPPYPNLYGFSFDNQDHDASLNEFLAGYRYSAYICVDPIGDCDAHIPDPLYWALWYPVHRYVINKSGGSCVGFSGTAAELFNNIIIPQDYDPEALFANGIDGSGFPGHYDTSNTGGRYTRPPIPTDIWGRIRANHGAQTSAEYMIHLLEQLDVGILSPHFGGNPVARLPELRAGTTAQAVCMVQGFDGGHCVTPYAVEGNYGGDPNKTRIWIYDNNNPCPIAAAADNPCVTNQFIDIDHSANEYIFPGNNWTGTALFTVPLSLYTGERTAPGLIDFAQALATFLVVVAGGADAHFTTPTGNEWGWRADGTFINNLPGLRAVPILGSPTNSTHSIPVLLPHSNGIPAIDIQMRDTNAHIFHVASGGTMLQLENAAGQPAHSNRITLGMVSNQLASFRFTPELAHSNFVSRIGFVVHSNACATFQWMGLNAEGGRALEFRALKSRRAVEFCNETTHSNTYYLRIDAVDGTSSNNACNVFGPFTVPTGAVHCVVLHDWPRTRQVRSELDLNADGIPDQVTIVTGTEIDSDGDGMPDAWETMHKLDPTSALCDDGPDADPDNDGVSNLGEYLADTDPHNPASALRLNATLLPGNKVRLSWKAVPGRRYEILYANTFEFVFQPLAAPGFPRVATSAEEHFDDTLPAGAARTRFYRLRLVP